MGIDIDSTIVVGWYIDENKLREYGAQNNVGSCGCDDSGGSSAKAAKCTQCLCDVEKSAEDNEACAASVAGGETGCWMNLPAEMDYLYIVRALTVYGGAPSDYLLSLVGYGDELEVADLNGIMADTALVARARALAIKLGADDADARIMSIVRVW
jgi:hypothetical protein